MKLTTTLAAVAAASISVAALAHTGATGIVLERMKAMSAMKDAMKVLTPMMRGEADYDPEAVRKAANTIQGHAGQSMTELFPEDNANEKSYVKDAIWEDWDDFEQLAMELETAAQGLARAAGNGLATEEAGAMDMGAMMGGDADAMMGGDNAMSGMMGGEAAAPTLEEMAEMPADAVFADLSRTCSACHTRFRVETD